MAAIFDLSNLAVVLVAFAVGHQLWGSYSVTRSKAAGFTTESRPAPQEQQPLKEQQDSDSDSLHEKSDSEEGDRFKMVLVVRSDLKMKPGKVAAQCAHATVGAVRAAERRIPKTLKKWEWEGQAKIALKVETEELMLDLEKAAVGAGLNTFVVQDAEIAAGRSTVLAIGPSAIDDVDKITRHLRLY